MHKGLTKMQALSAKVTEALVGALRDENEDVRHAAVQALMQVGEPAVEHLINALKDENLSVREAAARALGMIA